MAKTFFQKITIKKILVFSAISRLLLLPWTYHGDVIVTYWWGKFAKEFTWRGYYDWLNFGGYGRPDQPMLNIVYDWLIRLLYEFVYKIMWFINVNIPIFPSKIMSWYFFHGNQILLKLPMLVADIFLIYFVYKFISKEFGFTKAKIAAIILALYPPLFHNSIIWGSGDSIINLFALLAVFTLYKKKYYSFILLFLISVLYKSSLLIWCPVFLVIILKQRIKIKNILLMGGFASILIYIVSRPFAIKNSFIWFYETMTQKILPGAMPQITSNAMNFWAIIFGLKPRLDESLFLNIISFRSLSLIICVILYIYILIKLYKNYSLKSILLSLVEITLVTFVFMTRMHERYTFPALIPLLILCFYDRQFIKYFVILSITHYLNIYNWWFVPKIPVLISLLNLEIVIRSISVINLLLTIKLLTIKPITDNAKK